MNAEFRNVGELTIKDKVHRLHSCLNSISTGGFFSGDGEIYKRLRRELLAEADLRDKLPEFVHRYRDLDQFLKFIQNEFGGYQERSEFIRDSFRPLFDNWLAQDPDSGALPVSETQNAFDRESVYGVWQMALDRRTDDPEGAITAACTFLETVCKQILDDAKIEYSDSADLAKLWTIAAEHRNLAHHRHQAYKAILGNCQSIVNDIGSIRNRISDADVQGERLVKPKPRHTELVVNLACSMAAFLIGGQHGSLSNGKIEVGCRDF